MKAAFQRGATAISVVVTMLGLVVVLTLVAVAVVLGEQRSIANEQRAQLASSLADSALAQGMAHLRRNAALVGDAGETGWMSASTPRWQRCSITSIALPCGDGVRNLHDDRWTAYADVSALTTSSLGSQRLHYLARAAADGAPLPQSITVVVEARSADGGGHARQRQALRLAAQRLTPPRATLTAAGAVRVSGQLGLIAHPQGLGRELPLTVWSGGDVRFEDAARSCERGEYFLSAIASPGEACAACRCPTAPEQVLSNEAREGHDVIDRDAGQGQQPDTAAVVGDVLLYATGVGIEKARALRGEARVIANCETLDASSHGLLWVDGDCELPSASQAGSLAAPMLLLIAGHRLRLNAGAVLHGEVLMLPADAATAEIVVDTDARLHGAVLAAGALEVMGEGSIVYELAIEAALTSGPAAPTMATPVPGSWRDW